MSRTWTQTLLFTSLTVGGCCAFIIAEEIDQSIAWTVLFLLVALTLPDSFGRKNVRLWAISVISQLAFIFLKVL